MSKTKEDARNLERGRNKRSFLYRQVADQLRKEIEEGVYQPGDRVMSMDRLAERFNINKITVNKALKELTEEGLIYSIAAKGTFVSKPAQLQAVRRGDVMTVGIVSFVMFPGKTGHYHLSLQESIRSALGVRGANLAVLPAGYLQPRSRVVEMVMQSGLNGVICIGPMELHIVQAIADLGLPVAIMDHVAPGIEVDTIGQDNCGGACQAMRHLLELGHRHVAVVKGADAQVVTRERMDGVLAACDQLGIARSSLLIDAGEFLEEGGYEATRRLLSGEVRPTAIFYFNDEMALGGIHAIQEAGLSIPEDISIVGFDDVPLASSSHVRLTSVHAPTVEMGKMAVDLLFARLEERERPHNIARLCMSLVLRQSTAQLS